MIDASVGRWPMSSTSAVELGHRYRGLAWNFDFDTEEANIISYGGEGKFEVVRG
jgi:hypothetical protein